MSPLAGAPRGVDLPTGKSSGVKAVLANPDITVVIPYHNREQYIDEAVRSVRAQTLKPLEIIIVNDGSRESSRRYLDRYRSECTIVDLEKNSGAAAARNEGIRRARGAFIAFLDDDDIWLPHKLEVQRQYMEDHPSCAAVHSAVWAFFSNQEDVLWNANWSGPLTLAQALTDGYWVILQTTLVRRDVLLVLGGFDPRFPISEDRDLFIRACAAGYQIESISEPLVRLRRQGHQSLTAGCWRTFAMDLKLCWKHRADYYRAYGVRGFVSYILEKLRIASRNTRYLRGSVRLLMDWTKVSYKLRSDFREPVGGPNWLDSAAVKTR
jgi:glycosyltransferase involved in cell wall biosynthesis